MYRVNLYARVRRACRVKGMSTLVAVTDFRGFKIAPINFRLWLLADIHPPSDLRLLSPRTRTFWDRS